MQFRSSELQTRALSVWRGLSIGQKVALATAAIGMVIASATFLIWGQRPEYATLYTNMEERDAAEVVERLKEAKVPYQIGANGRAVLVPADKVHEVRLELAGEGFPKGGGVGFELFDRTNLAVTDFAQRLNYQRALEGELARTIGQLAPVASARVHLVIPKPELYTEKEKEASASVVVNLRPGRQLDEKQVRAIANLVAGSVEGLKPANLTIVDAGGNILSDGQLEASAPGRLSNSQMEAQRSYERWQESRLNTLLDRVLGPGRAAVRVTALLDWDQMEQNNETYNPDGQQSQLRSMREAKERQPSGGVAGGGIPGPTSNVPSYVGTEQEGDAAASADSAASTPGEYERTELVQNFEVSKTVERIIRAPGSVKRMSVAVILDDGVAEEQMAAIGEAVTAAVGLDERRGDVISVTRLPFDKSLQSEEAVQAIRNQQTELFRSLAMAAVAAFAVVILAIFLARLARSLNRAEVRLRPPQMTVQAAVPALEAAESTGTVYQYQQLSTLAKNQPQAVASVIKAWLDEK